MPAKKIGWTPYGPALGRSSSIHRSDYLVPPPSHLRSTHPYQSVAHVDYGQHETTGDFYAYIFGSVPNTGSRSGSLTIQKEEVRGSVPLARKAANELRREFSRLYRPAATHQWDHYLRKE